jgi:hypothetical protein
MRFNAQAEGMRANRNLENLCSELVKMEEYTNIDGFVERCSFF